MQCEELPDNEVGKSISNNVSVSCEAVKITISRSPEIMTTGIL
jgi:hypothetical protein